MIPQPHRVECAPHLERRVRQFAKAASEHEVRATGTKLGRSSDTQLTASAAAPATSYGVSGAAIARRLEALCWRTARGLAHRLS